MPEIDPCLADGEFIRARAGEHAAFAALVRTHQRRVYGIALRMLGDRALAEDLSQEVFLQLHLSLRAIESASHLAFWLRRVTAHRAIDLDPGEIAHTLDMPVNTVKSHLKRSLATLRLQLCGETPDAKVVAP